LSAVFTVTDNTGRAIVTWEDGEMTGDPVLLQEVRLAIQGGYRVAATPTGPAYTAALVPDYVALATILHVLGSRRVVIEGRSEVPG
jgi:hypothetical protein